MPIMISITFGPIWEKRKAKALRLLLMSKTLVLRILNGLPDWYSRYTETAGMRESVTGNQMYT